MVFCPNGAQGDIPGQSEAPPWDSVLSRVFPTVAWPSEAVRVRDDLIKFIHKQETGDCPRVFSTVTWPSEAVRENIERYCA